MQPSNRRILISERLVNSLERPRLWGLLFIVVKRSDHYGRVDVTIGKSDQNEIADFGQHRKTQTTDGYRRALQLDAAGSQTNIGLMIVFAAVSGKYFGDQSQFIEPAAGQFFADDRSQHG